MFICICKSVTDKVINSAIADGCHCIKSVCCKTGAGTQCGKCVKAIKTEIQKTQKQS